NHPDLLFMAINSVAILLRRQVPTLVCCSAGMSRSPAIAAAAISNLSQSRLEDCLQHVAEKHAADISPGLWRDVVRSYNEERSAHRESLSQESNPSCSI